MFKPIRYLKISTTIYTDVSLEGWGASMGIVSTGGAWLTGEKLMHINVFELKTVLLALKSFVKTSHKHIKIMSDNIAEIHCIKKNRNITSNGMSSPSAKNLGMGNYIQKSSFSNSHCRETKHSC